VSLVKKTQLFNCAFERSKKSGQVCNDLEQDQKVPHWGLDLLVKGKYIVVVKNSEA
jgi:hypothetical protein